MLVIIYNFIIKIVLVISTDKNNFSSLDLQQFLEDWGINFAFLFISSLILEYIKNKLEKTIYWIIASIPILFWSWIAIYFFAMSEYKLRNLFLFIIPTVYFLTFYYNYKRVIKELKKNEAGID